MTCPGCDAHLSDILRAYEERDPCPNCGLLADTTSEILAVRERVGAVQLKKQLEEALINAGRFESEAKRLKRQLDEIRWTMSPLLEESWRPDA